MDFQHHKTESQTHGYSPGNGITPTFMSRAPLATEGEATPGPDDWNPFEEREYEEFRQAQTESFDDPTAGDDPFVFDDIGKAIPEFEAPGLSGKPTFNFEFEL